MANSSHNSSFSLHNATPKQFEEAFEELYLQSPLPRLTKPLFAAREKRPAPPAAQITSRVKIKAIFDTMKERNSSMCSELNSSVCTSNTSLCDVDAERLPARDLERPRQKENTTPSRDKDQDEVDHIAGICETPRSSRRPAVADSPAQRVALHFSQHAAMLDSLLGSDTGPAAPSTNTTRCVAGSDTDRDTGPAGLTTPSTNTSQLGAGQPHTCPAQDREGSQRSGEVTDAGQLTDPSDSRTGCENATAAEKVTSEVCLPLSQGTVEVTAGQRVQNEGSSLAPLSANLTFESAYSSPSKSVDESGADQETLQLVSKLVQRLQCSGQKTTQDEDSDDWDLMVKPLASPSAATSARDLQLSETSGAKKATHADDDSDCDLQGLTANPLSSRSRSTAVKGSSKATVYSKRSQKTTCEKMDSRASSNAVDTAKTCATTKQRQMATSRETAGSEQPTAANRETVGSKQPTTATRETAGSEQPTAANRETACSKQPTAATRETACSKQPTAANRETACSKQPTAATRETACSKQPTAATRETACSKQPTAANRCQTRSAARQQKTAGTRTITAQHTLPVVREASSTGEEEGKSKGKNTAAVRSGKEKAGDELEDGEEVEDDIITRPALIPVQSTKDPFSLDISSDDEDLQVDEDAITFAAKTFGRCQPGTRQRAGKGTRSTSQVSARKKVKAEARRAEVKAAAAGKVSKVHKLSCWSLQPIAHLKSVRIEGKLPNTEYFWLSSLIVERVSSRVVKSTSGSLYQLMGNMAELHNRAAGFSEEFTQLFKRGFPVDWKELVESSVASAEKKSKSLLSCTLPMPSRKDSKQDSQRAGHKEKTTLLSKSSRATGDQRKGTPVSNGTRGTGEGERLRTPPLRKGQAALDANSFHTPPQQRLGTVREDSATIWTPQGVMSRQLEANAVRRTQSGRCVIPPLARWAGQYLQHDDNGNVTIAFASMAAEKHFGQMAHREMLAPVRLRNTPMGTKIRPVRMGTGSRGGSQRQHSRASKSASHPAGDKHTTTGGTGQRGTGQRGRGQHGRGSCGRPDVPVDNYSKEMMSLEEEVMSVVHESKVRRQQRVTRKRNTCYANAAADSQGNMNTAMSHSSDDDSDEDLVPQKNPVRSRVKPGLVKGRRLMEDSPEPGSEDAGPRGRGETRRRQTGQQSSTELSPHSPQKKVKGGGRGKAQQSSAKLCQDSPQKTDKGRSKAQQSSAKLCQDSPQKKVKGGGKAQQSSAKLCQDSPQKTDKGRSKAQQSSAKLCQDSPQKTDKGRNKAQQSSAKLCQDSPQKKVKGGGKAQQSSAKLCQDSPQKTDKGRGKAQQSSAKLCQDSPQKKVKGGGKVQQSSTELSPHSPQKKVKGGGKAQQSDCSMEERRPKRTNTRRATTRARAAGGASRGKKRSEPVMDADETEDCAEEEDCEQPETTYASPSCAVATAVGGHAPWTRGTARRNTGQAGIPALSCDARRRQPTARSTGGGGEELVTDHLVRDDGEEKPGGTKGRGQSQSRSRRGQSGRERGTGRNSPLKGGGAGSSVKENLSSSADLEGSRLWSTKEIQNLHRGVESVQSDQPDYWAAVSEYVGSRSARECAVFHLKDGPSKAPRTRDPQPSAQQHNTHNDKTPVLRGKRGTLKRRRELRAILEHGSNKNDNNQDDLFQATPFRAGKKAKVAAVDFSKTDEEVFGSNPDFFTPRVGETWQSLGRTFSHTPASPRKTPSISTAPSPWTTKDSAHKRDVDQYIFRLKKNKRQLAKSFNKMKPQQEKGVEADAACPTSLALLGRSAPVPQGLFSITEDTVDQEDEEDDYYYSEEEN